MPKEKRNWHPRFIQYMDQIANHPSYSGLALKRKADGSYGWIATARSAVGRDRIAWCLEKAKELGYERRPGVYADVMLAIHPTKRKVCQTCGKEMSLLYHYPNATFLAALNRQFGTAYTTCDHISEIWDDLRDRGVEESRIGRFLIDKGKLALAETAGKEAIIAALEYACRKGGKQCLGPGAMANFPDRFDGFHSYNRCCRDAQDTGRSKENLRTYTKDRRAYEYWSDGNIHAADQFMASDFFRGTSADHIGPISLGFVHDPRYLQPMARGDNSSKRDRLQREDVEKLIETEGRTGISPMSWYSRDIWEYIKRHYEEHPDRVETVYRDALKQNRANFMYVLWCILENCPQRGRGFLECAYLEPKMRDFQFDYSFNAQGEITRRRQRHLTERSYGEEARCYRIAIESVYDYMDKKNRNRQPKLIGAELMRLDEICGQIEHGAPVEEMEGKLAALMEQIQARLISHM